MPRFSCPAAESPFPTPGPSRLRVSALLIASLILGVLAATARADVDNYNRGLNSTAWVLALNADGNVTGTGVLVDQERRLLVTNAHVVGASRNVVIFFRSMKNGEPIVDKQHYLTNAVKLAVKGRVLHVDRQRDLALVQLTKVPSGIQAIPMAENSTRPGSRIDSIGNPGSSEALWVFTTGSVRAVYQKQFSTGSGEHKFKVVETQSPLNTGDSGGPVLNEDGELVAIVQAISKRGNLFSFCVDISEVRTFLESPWKPAPLPITQVLDTTDLEYERHDSGHLQLEITLNDDTTDATDASDQDESDIHTVFVAKDYEYFEQADVRQIWALAAASTTQPEPPVLMELLSENTGTKLGSWTIGRDKEGRYLITYVAKLDASASAQTLASTIQCVAEIAAAKKSRLAQQLKPAAKQTSLAEWLAK
ncbi:MAG: serine protease [Planctomycetota bacterium]